MFTNGLTPKNLRDHAAEMDSPLFQGSDMMPKPVTKAEAEEKDEGKDALI